MTQLLQVGLSHEEAPLPVLERALAAEAAVRERVAQAVADGVLQEAAVLGTCHRLEVYAIAGADRSPAHLRELLASALRPGPEAPPLQERSGRWAVQHLCEVAAGLRSLVIGEREVFDQVRAAWRRADAEGTAGPVLSVLFRQAIQAGRTARRAGLTLTDDVSLAALGVQAARRAAGSLRERCVVIAGTGRMGRLARDLVAREAAGSVAVVTRRPERITDRNGFSVHGLPELPALVTDADVIISATASLDPILSRSQVEAAFQRRRRDGLVLIDLGVPRDFDPAIAEVPGVRLLNLDDLRPLAAEVLRVDAAAVARARLAAAAAADRALDWLAGRAVAQDLSALHTHAERIRADELRRLLQEHPSLSPQERAGLETLSRRVVARLVHEATVQLKALAANGHPPLGRPDDDPTA